VNELMEKMKAQLDRDRAKVSGAASQQPAKFEMSDKTLIDSLTGWDLLLFLLFGIFPAPFHPWWVALCCWGFVFFLAYLMHRRIAEKRSQLKGQSS
jgi:hypothetical protein